MQNAKRMRIDCSPARKDDEVEPDDEEHRTLFCANLSEHVTEELLYELFIQSGPLESVRIPKDKDGRPRQFGFVTFSHACTVPYAIELYRGVRLFNRDLVIKFRNQNSRDIVITPRPRIDSLSLLGERATSPIINQPRIAHRPSHDNGKIRFQSDSSNLTGMRGPEGGGSKRRHDAGMQPNFNRNTPKKRGESQSMNINDLAMLGSNMMHNNPFKGGQADFNFDNALESLLKMQQQGPGKRNSDGGGGGHMNRGDSQQGNFFRQNKSPRNNNMNSNRGRHDNRDRPSNRRHGGNRR